MANEKWIPSLIGLFLLLASGISYSTPNLDFLYQIYGKKYDLDPLLIKSIAQVESSDYPWTVNVNHRPFFFDSQQQVIDFLKQAKKKPWLLEIYNGKTIVHRQLFKSKKALLAAKRKYKKYKAVYKKINANYADIGPTQINWYWVGRHHLPNKDELTNPRKAVETTAKHLKSLIDSYGLEEGVGKYHNFEYKRWKPYSEKVLKKYRNLVRLHRN